MGGVGSSLRQFNYPADVAVLGDLAYVVETGNHRVQIFDAAGRSVGAMGEDILNYPGGIITTASGWWWTTATGCEPFTPTAVSFW